MHAESGAEPGGSRVQAEAAAKVTRPRDAGTGNEGGVGNGEE
jgi:hypothetical protein